MNNFLEEKIWFRIAKVVYVGLWILGLGCAGIFAHNGDAEALVATVIATWTILALLKKAFLYIMVGKSL